MHAPAHTDTHTHTQPHTSRLPTTQSWAGFHSPLTVYMHPSHLRAASWSHCISHSDFNKESRANVFDATVASQAPGGLCGHCDHVVHCEDFYDHLPSSQLASKTSLSVSECDFLAHHGIPLDRSLHSINHLIRRRTALSPRRTVPS